ncbi:MULTISPECIES: aquaporin [Leifsonia]|uniref:Aquaporin family protein n=1 Tax=Leifsonia virtsii TaxID=3035915 RepID=A0ABT8IY19_9MICO|nr:MULTISPECIES: MIP/aquaporin family protein [Leifsonia]MDN4597700.1 aquaporin family protein [Leifsonia virtsii]NUU08212.1 aquaporin family protein [Leifsonia sp. C5G2]
MSATTEAAKQIRIPTIAVLRPALAEFVGSAGLTAVVVGSGIAAQHLSPGDTGLQLLENALATALGLTVLVLVFAPSSGAQFNPVVSLVDAAAGGRPWRGLWSYIPAQVLGCLVGAVLANLMFEQPAARWSSTERATPAHLLAEVVATAGLILVIFVLARTGRAAIVAPAVGAYIGAAYWFTSSTSFANPAITIGRTITDTFAGIAPGSAPWYIGAQLIGAGLGLAAVRVFAPNSSVTR